MTRHPITRRSILAGAAALVLASNAYAHHGWSWTVEEQSEVTGTIQECFSATRMPS